MARAFCSRVSPLKNLVKKVLGSVRFEADAVEVLLAAEAEVGIIVNFNLHCLAATETLYTIPRNSIHQSGRPDMIGDWMF